MRWEKETISCKNNRRKEKKKKIKREEIKKGERKKGERNKKRVKEKWKGWKKKKNRVIEKERK